jgi:predicted transcriptional regulator
MVKTKKQAQPTLAEQLKAKHLELAGQAAAKIGQAAKRLQVSEATIYNMMAGRSTIKVVQAPVLAEIYGIELEKEVPHEA